MCSERKRGKKGRGVLISLLLLLIAGSVSAQTLTSVSGNTVTLNIGSKDGVKVGMTAYVIYEEEVSGQMLPLKIAKIKVTAVKSHSTTAAILEKSMVVARGMSVQFIDKLVMPHRQKPRIKPKPRTPPRPKGFQIEPGKDLFFYLDKGNAYLNQRDFTKAKLYFERVLKDMPSDPMAKKGLNAAESGIREAGVAAEQARKRKELLKNADYLEKAGDRAAEAGQYDMALDYYQQILNVIPDDARLLEKKADVLISGNRKKEAKAVLKTILSSHPERYDIKNKLKSLVPDPGEIEIVTLPGGGQLQLAWIPPGSFLMGSPSSESGRSSDEGPQHRVTISHGFYMGKYEVTQAQWKAIMGNNPSRFKGDNLPVEEVSWNDVQKFIQKLNRQTGLHFRLPTEAEWEYACRGGTDTAFCYGDSESQLGDYAWYGSNSNSKTHPVGQKQPNAWGLYDMHGNVWEWCSDWYDSDYYKNSPSTDPTGPATGDLRVFRGGSWYNSAQYCRSALRDWNDPSSRFHNLGFRLILADE